MTQQPTRARIRCASCGLAVGAGETRCAQCGADVRLWVRRGARVWGPFDLGTAAAARQSGRIADDDEITVGNSGWVRAADLDFTPAMRVAVAKPRRVVSSRTLSISAAILGGAVVVAAVLCGWTYYRWDRERDAAACRQNLRVIALAVRAYSLRHKGAKVVIDANLPQELKSVLAPLDRYWTCPTTHKPYCVAAGPVGKGAAGYLVWDAPEGRSGPHGGSWNVALTSGKVISTRQRPPKGTPVRGITKGTEPTRIAPLPGAKSGAATSGSGKKAPAGGAGPAGKKGAKGRLGGAIWGRL